MSETDHRSSLFLLELILALFFFALASAVCMQLFAKAHTLSNTTTALNDAIPLAETVADTLSAAGGEFSALSELFPDGVTAKDTMTVYFDENFDSMTEGSAAAYTLTICCSKAGASAQLLTGSVRITDQTGSILYELPISCRVPRTVSSGKEVPAA